MYCILGSDLLKKSIYDSLCYLVKSSNKIQKYEPQTEADLQKEICKQNKNNKTCIAPSIVLQPRVDNEALSC